MSGSSEAKAKTELTELYGQLPELRSQIEKHYETALEWKTRRDDLNKITSPLVSKLKEEREQRNQANEKVAELMTLKESFRKELEETEELIEELNSKKQELISSLKEDPDRVRERIRELGWFSKLTF